MYRGVTHLTVLWHGKEPTANCVMNCVPYFKHHKHRFQGTFLLRKSILQLFYTPFTANWSLPKCPVLYHIFCRKCHLMEVKVHFLNFCLLNQNWEQDMYYPLLHSWSQTMLGANVTYWYAVKEIVWVLWAITLNDVVTVTTNSQLSCVSAAY